MFDKRFTATSLDGLVDTLANAVADTDDDVLAGIAFAVRMRAAADHLLARMADDADRLGTSKRRGMRTRELLIRNGCAPSVAARAIRVGPALAELTITTRYSRDGIVSGEHIDAVVRGVRHIARRCGELADRDLLIDAESQLITVAVMGLTPGDIAERARELAIEWTPAGRSWTERQIPAAEDTTLNEVSWTTGADGRLRGEFDLDCLTGERLIAAVDAASRPRPLPDGAPDPRSTARRRADAFGQLLECGSRAMGDEAAITHPHTDVVMTVPIAGPDGHPRDAAARLNWLGPLSDLSAKRLACDAALTRVGLDANGAPVEITDSRRLFTGRVRKAIAVRDRCCVKCGGPASWTDVHHIIHFSDGGPTVCDNGCLLCRSCHADVHHHGWNIVMGEDRHPWLIPPAAVDPRRRRQPSYNRRTLRLDVAA